jgi:hypothetical protein
MLLASKGSRLLHSSASGVIVVSDPVGEWTNMWFGMAEGGAPFGMRMPSGVPVVELGYSAMKGCLRGIKKGADERDGQDIKGESKKDKSPI